MLRPQVTRPGTTADGMTLMSGPLEMDLVGIGLILVLGVILGADANDAHVIPLGLSPPLLARKGPRLDTYLPGHGARPDNV